MFTIFINEYAYRKALLLFQIRVQSPRFIPVNVLLICSSVISYKTRKTGTVKAQIERAGEIFFIDWSLGFKISSRSRMKFRKCMQEVFCQYFKYGVFRIIIKWLLLCGGVMFSALNMGEIVGLTLVLKHVWQPGNTKPVGYRVSKFILWKTYFLWKLLEERLTCWGRSLMHQSWSRQE